LLFKFEVKFYQTEHPTVCDLQRYVMIKTSRQCYGLINQTRIA